MWPECRTRATVHESRVTSVQKRMEPRRSLLGASVDVTDARNVADRQPRPHVRRSESGSNCMADAMNASRLNRGCFGLPGALPAGRLRSSHQVATYGPAAASEGFGRQAGGK